MAPARFTAWTVAWTSGIVPTALVAAGMAIQRVLSVSTASMALAGSSSVLRSGSANRTVGAGGGDDPPGAVGVVVQAGADDLVAGRERAADGGGEAHRQRGHARAEGDAARIGAEQPAHGLTRLGNDLVRVLGGGEQTAVVGVASRA